ncbi:hypothetical protein Ciccas_003044 [Cichlidogyrus casuarinus]|uniref:Secreted protein n=1 Tax=Cichlidogyrus casuarinus TaxID=1844966 RepID=A0ABD2QFI8_9PLAT
MLWKSICFAFLPVWVASIKCFKVALTVSAVEKEDLNKTSACLVLIVLDKDLLVADDFEGCVFISLKSLFHGKMDATPHILKCPLIHPRTAGQCSICTIKYPFIEILGRF